MTPEEQAEIEQLAAQTPTRETREPVAQPTGRTLGAVNELIETMTAIDKARMQFFEAEQKKMVLLEDNIMRRMEEKFGERFSASNVAESAGMDPIMVEGAKFLFNIVGNSMAAQKAAPPSTQTMVQQAMASAAATPSAAPSVATVEKTESEQVSKYTDDQIARIADGIYEHFPKDVRAFKLGAIDREGAIKKVLASGMVSREDAERIVTVMENTDYPMEDA